MKTLLLSLLIIVNLMASNKYLKSQDRAEVYAQNLLESGEYQKAKKFLFMAKEKYPKSESLWMFSATTAYELKNFDEAKIYFIRTLEINPKNEQAAHFKNLIDQQERALQNSDIENLFEYLSDKGVDFLSIFLAFLGGEIIARRFSKCNSMAERNLVFQYQRKDQLNNFKKRVSFSLKNYFKIEYIFSFCSFLNLLIIFVISSSITIFILLLELISEFSIFSSKALVYMSSSELANYIWLVFFISFLFTIFIRLFMYIIYLKESSKNIELEIVQYLENLSSENKLDKMKNFFKLLNCKSIKEIETIFNLLSDDCKRKVEYLIKVS